MTASNSSVFRFSDIEVREGELRATRAGAPLSIEPKAFRVLVYLLKNPNRLVTKDELLSAVWGDTAVTDNSLTRAIALLRRVLEDDPRQPHFIETVATVGYRFICPVEAVGEIPGKEDPRASERAHSTGSSRSFPALWDRRWRHVPSAVLAAITLFGVFVALNTAGLRDRLLSAIRPASSPNVPVIHSIAILPFENLSGDPGQEYFADGMTDELITNLGAVSPVRVISRSSVMRFKGTRKALPEIAGELGVDGIVEGTVVRSGNRVRITANLLYAATDRHLWASSYESELEDVLTVQGHVARAVADAVRSEVADRRPTPSAATRRVNGEAFQAYLEALYLGTNWTEEGLTKAAAGYRRAQELDPAFAPSYAGTASVYCLLAVFGRRPAPEAFATAKEAASKALELDDTLAEAHAAMGLIKMTYDWDWSGAETEFRRALALNPSSPESHYKYGIFLTAMRRNEQAIGESREALRLDPLTPTSNLQLGWVLFFAGRYEESISQLKRTLEVAPDLPWAHMELGWSFAEKHQFPEAIRQCQKALTLLPNEQVILGTCGNVYGKAGRRKEALALLEQLEALSKKRYVDPYYLAIVYDALGDTDRAVECYERAYQQHAASVYGLRGVLLISERLRSDPRYLDLVSRLKFPS